jgi:hypothetical protein
MTHMGIFGALPSRENLLSAVDRPGRPQKEVIGATQMAKLTSGSVKGIGGGGEEQTA